MEAIGGGESFDHTNETEEVVKSEQNCLNQKTGKRAWPHCKKEADSDSDNHNNNNINVDNDVTELMMISAVSPSQASVVEVEKKLQAAPIFRQDEDVQRQSQRNVNAGENNPETDSRPTVAESSDGDVEVMIFEESPTLTLLSNPHQEEEEINQNISGSKSNSGTESDRTVIYVDEAVDDVLNLNDMAKEFAAVPLERNAVHSFTESNIVNIPFGLPITVSELVVTSLNFPAKKLPVAEPEPEDSVSEEGPSGAKMPRLENSEDNLDDCVEIRTSPLPSPNDIDMAQPSDQVTSSSPVISDMVIRKNLMTVLSPSQSSSIGSLSTQISPSTCSLDCSRDSVSMEDTEHEELLCYPTFEELQQSYNVDSSSESITVLSEAVLKNAVLSQQVSESDENQVIQPGLPVKIINCQVQPGNPAFTTPHRPWSTKMAPPQNIAPQPSGPPPRRVHFVNLPRTPAGGSDMLPAKGTPHPAQGVYIPGQSTCHRLGFPLFKHRTPTGYIIRQAAPYQKPLGVSPHASPANISLNSSGEENSTSSPDEATPPPHVPYNTPQSGIVNNPRFPLCNRLINDSNIFAQLEATVRSRVQSSPNTLEGFAKFRSPFPAEAVASDGNVHTVPDQDQFTEQDLALGRDHHNAKERRRRLRIKDASTKLKEIVPGLTSKTDKATVFEHAAEYILYMKQIVGSKYDGQFISQGSPY